MGIRYRQLSLEERIEIYRLHAAGISLRKIAARIGRSAGTVSRELRRNGKSSKKWQDGYKPVRAQKLCRRRRARGCAHKLERQPELRAFVLERLAMGWSPEQIAGRLAQGHHSFTISHESIYRYIYWRASLKDRLYHLLPRKKYRRGNYSHRLPRRTIPFRTSIHERPLSVSNRSRFGHWEADLMAFSKPGQAVLVVCERKSRRIILRRQTTRTSRAVIGNIGKILAEIPPGKGLSFTFDNGSEFTSHYRLGETHAVKTWFCDPRSPWQKGSVENAIGRLRRSLPRKTQLHSLTDLQINKIIDAYNNTPRKCLGFKTPDEVFFGLPTTVALQS
jgi:IS30 family transposase